MLDRGAGGRRGRDILKRSLDREHLGRNDQVRVDFAACHTVTQRFDRGGGVADAIQLVSSLRVLTVVLLDLLGEGVEHRIGTVDDGEVLGRNGFLLGHLGDALAAEDQTQHQQRQKDRRDEERLGLDGLDELADGYGDDLAH